MRTSPAVPGVFGGSGGRAKQEYFAKNAWRVVRFAS